MGRTMIAIMNVPIISLSNESTITTSTLSPTPGKSTLLLLPLEIRLQIYGYILESHPAKHTHLSPSPNYPSPTSSAYFLRAINVPIALQSAEAQDEFRNISKSLSSTHSSFKTLGGTGCGYIPDALLMTCKQVYNEARMLPWEQNEFVFINWFCSGVYSARSFMKAQKPWQRENMRWARIEVLRRDLEDTWVATMVGGRPGAGEWKDLCALWSGGVETGERGLWGLRLGLKGRVGDYPKGETIEEPGVVGVAFTESATQNSQVGEHQDKQKRLLDVDAQWVTQGLAQMKALRWLEIEIEDKDIPRDEKVRFCLDLGQKLSDLLDRKVDVLFAEKLIEDVKPTKDDESDWGEPGDDYIWGVDS